jgi:uncharacterized membrane protein (DUF373 family)
MKSPENDPAARTECLSQPTTFLDDEGFTAHRQEPLIVFLHKIIHFSVRVLAVLMTAVILWGIGDVVWILYNQLKSPPFLLLNINDILATFGAFMAVLIAIEIFINITLYLRDDFIHVKLVMATALMAIARKVIIFDYDKLTPGYVYATGVVILALSLGYWLVTGKGTPARVRPCAPEEE